MDNEDDVEDRSNNFLEKADANLLKYCREGVELRRLLVEARNRGDYELRE